MIVFTIRVPEAGDSDGDEIVRSKYRFNISYSPNL
jgi:hypothetical protein